MNFSEPEVPGSGPQQHIELSCREWLVLFIRHTPVAFGVNRKKELVLILEPATPYERSLYPPPREADMRSN